MNIEKLVLAAKEIEARVHKLEARTKYFRDLAAEARRTGKPQKVVEPQVVDFEDPIRDLIRALHARPSKKK
jgi:hypothetical protein